MSVCDLPDEDHKIAAGGTKKSQESFAVSEQNEILQEIKFVFARRCHYCQHTLPEMEGR